MFVIDWHGSAIKNFRKKNTAFIHSQIEPILGLESGCFAKAGHSAGNVYC